MKRLTIFAAALLLLAGNETYSQTLPSFDDGIRAIRNNAVPGLHYGFDDWLQYSPLAVTVGMKAFGYDSRSFWGRMVVSDAFSAAAMAAAVNGLKYTVRRPRPDGTSNNSFPSGHTATSFMMATMMHKEYGWRSPWFSIGAYTVAAATGVSRVLNDRHYTTDVVAGAAIGIAATHLGYFIADKIFKDRHINSEWAAPQPFIDPSKKYYELGLYFGYRFILNGDNRVAGGGTSGIQAEIPVIPRAGVCARVGASSFMPSDSPSWNAYSFMAGGYWNLSFLKIMSFDVKALAGYSLSGGMQTRMLDGFDFAVEAGIGVLSGENFRIKALVGYEAIRNTTQKPFLHTLTAGGSASFFW